jgi:hypothetical protein
MRLFVVVSVLEHLWFLPAAFVGDFQGFLASAAKTQACSLVGALKNSFTQLQADEGIAGGLGLIFQADQPGIEVFQS